MNFFFNLKNKLLLTLKKFSLKKKILKIIEKEKKKNIALLSFIFIKNQILKLIPRLNISFKSVFNPNLKDNSIKQDLVIFNRSRAKSNNKSVLDANLKTSKEKTTINVNTPEGVKNINFNIPNLKEHIVNDKALKPDDLQDLKYYVKKTKNNKLKMKESLDQKSSIKKSSELDYSTQDESVKIIFDFINSITSSSPQLLSMGLVALNIALYTIQENLPQFNIKAPER